MGFQVEKIDGDDVAVIHRNLSDQDAKDVARAVIAGNAPGAVQVRLTPLRWDDENAEYRLAPDDAILMPRDEPPVEEKPAAKKPAAKKKGS